MNYRHGFHAGNFADLVKHAALLEVMARMGRPLSVVDTHAGAGRYDLEGAEARRSGEAADGVVRLMAAAELPMPLERLAEAVRRANPDGRLRCYPGSPWLTAEALGPGDRLVVCELAPQVHAELAALMKGHANVQTRRADGYEVLTRLTVAGSALALVDPPFERADDYSRACAAVGAWLARNPQAVAMIWTPLKDLETFDGFLRDLSAACPGAPLLAAETRLRPLTDPMRMNGCALVFVRPPADLAASLEQICAWIASSVGEAGAASRIWTPA